MVGCGQDPNGGARAACDQNVACEKENALIAGSPAAERVHHATLPLCAQPAPWS